MDDATYRRLVRTAEADGFKVSRLQRSLRT